MDILDFKGFFGYLFTNAIGCFTFDFIYSVLRLFTGFAKADLIDCMLIVKNAINIERTAAATKTQALISVLYAKS